MSFYNDIKSYKKEHKINNDDLGLLLGKTGDVVRKSLSRQSLSNLEIAALKNYIHVNDLELPEDYSDHLK